MCECWYVSGSARASGLQCLVCFVCCVPVPLISLRVCVRVENVREVGRVRTARAVIMRA